MKKILLIYLPFCTPASPPYSVISLYSFLKNNSNHKIEVLDLNLEFHKLKFSKYQKYFQNSKKWKDYDKVTKEFQELSKKTYSENNKKVVDGKKPEFFEQILWKIKEKKPDIIAFSIVYSSQAFYAYALMKELKNVVIGGPAVNEKLIKLADKCLNNEMELLDFVSGQEIKHDKLKFNFPLDFSVLDLKQYFTPYPVIPIRTSNTCNYKQCTFCSHFSTVSYCEFDLNVVKKTVVGSGQKYFFIIDDTIHKKRLLEIAKMLKPLKVNWMCQLRPVNGLDFKTLKKSGLKMIIWGVESGCQRVLNLMKKGTQKKDVIKVLSDSHKAGIKNVLYIMFGFPGESKEEFLETIDFLKQNDVNIDLISVSVFGLQKGTEIYKNYKKFGITRIIEKKRTVLEPKISYEVKEGLSQEQVLKLRKGHKKTIDNINKYPKLMNFFREHMFIL